MTDHKTTDRRKHARFEIFEFTQILCDDPTPSPSLIVDISLGGLQTRSRRTFEVGQVCTLQIGRGGSDPLEINAEVCYSAPVEEGAELISTGFRFKPKNAADRMALVDYVHEIFQREGERLTQ